MAVKSVRDDRSCVNVEWAAGDDGVELITVGGGWWRGVVVVRISRKKQASTYHTISEIQEPGARLPILPTEMMQEHHKQLQTILSCEKRLEFIKVYVSFSRWRQMEDDNTFISRSCRFTIEIK